MSNVAIMTDTTACIPVELMQELQINVVPAAHIMVNGKTYVENETITATEAYELLKKDPDRFITSAITPSYLLDAYRDLGKQNKEIFFITISSALSAVYQTANSARDLFQNEAPDTTIHIMDSKTTAGAMGLITIAAVKAASQGMSLEKIMEISELVRKNTNGIMLLDTLRYVYRTGRMSKTASRIVSMLNIKPINRISENGTVEMVSRVRKTELGLQRLIELIKQDSGTDALHFMVSHTAAIDTANHFAEQLRQNFNCLSLIISDYSPVMGYGAGPGAIFVGFHPELNLS